MKIKEIKATKSSWSALGKKVERLRVAAYCRVSTDDKDQIHSYLSQKKYYETLIKEKKEWHYAGVYADAAQTGTKVDNRTDFQKLINVALEGDIDMIITKSIARFARNTYDTLKYVRMLKEKHVAVLFEEENINTMTMDGELLLTILSSVAQQEVENISANVKKGLKMKMKRGELVGFVSCLGYDYDKTTKTLMINEEGARTVRYIFDRYSSGYGATMICKELNELGWKTKKGNEWGSSSIIGIIRNEKYVGDLMMGKSFTVDPISKRRLPNNGEEDKYYITDHHEPIINRETFKKAHEYLKKRSYERKPKGSNTTREKYSRKYAFSSMLECGFCGSNLSRRSWHSNSQYQKIIWQCITNSKDGKKHCGHAKGVPEEIIELAFMESYTMLAGKDRELVDSFVSQLESSLGTDVIKKKINNEEQKLSKIENKKKKLLDLLLEEDMNKRLFETSIFEQEEKEKNVRASIDELLIQLEHEQELTKRIESFKKILSGKAEFKEFDRKVFEALIEKVIVGHIDDGNVDPYKLTFIYKTGLDYVIDGAKHKKDGRRKKSTVLPSNNPDDHKALSSNQQVDTCRGGLSVGKRIEFISDSVIFYGWIFLCKNKVHDLESELFRKVYNI
jgi:DNA invertase Pin-like site-specific DNA recombinase